MFCFVGARLFDAPPSLLVRSVLPFILVYVIALMVVTYVLWVSVWLPQVLR